MFENSSAFTNVVQQHGLEALIRNARAEIVTENLGNYAVPISVSMKLSPRNHYFLSPKSAYIDYAKLKLPSNLKGAFLSAGMSAFWPVIRVSKLDHQVQINNWMTSTAPLSSDARNHIGSLTERLVMQYPERAITLRSVNTFQHADLIIKLNEIGYLLLPNRQIYMQSVSKADRWPSNLKRDRKFLAKSDFLIKSGRDFESEDFERAICLYNSLYIEKHSDLNPQYTSLFLREMTRIGMFDVKGVFTADGTLVAWIGNHIMHDTICTPIGGYDTTRPIGEGLYRIMNALAQEIAFDQDLQYNMSSGSGHFKMQRGGVPVMEYLAVYVKHLPHYRQVATKILKKALDTMSRQPEAPKKHNA